MKSRSRFVCTIALFLALVAEVSVAATQKISFEIPPQELGGGLREFARQADLQVLYEQNNVAGLETPGVRGAFEPPEALDRLLEGTNLLYEFSGSETVSIRTEDDQEDKKGGSAATTRTHAEADLPSPPASVGAPVANGPQSERQPTEAQDESGADEGEADDTDQDESSETFVDAILVTASKQGEVDAQDLANSITAFNNEKLERLDALDFEDFIVQVPGTNFIDNGGPGRGQEVASIRGISRVADNTVSVVAQYLDGAPRFGGSYRLFDIGEVAVLRGPQGTLWGSQAVGGLISYRSNRPDPTARSWSFTTDLYATGESSGASHRLVAHANLPIVEDKFAVRVAGHQISEEGYIDNIATGAEDINKVDETAWRLSALYRPSEKVTVTAIYHGNDLTADAPTFFDLDLGERQTDSPVDVTPATQEYDLINLIVDADLGWANLNYTGAQFDFDNVYNDVSRGFFGFIPLARTDTILREESTTHELRLSSTNSGRVGWIVGLYSDELDQFDLTESVEIQDPTLPPGSTAIGNGALVFFLGGPQSFKEKAIFGEVTIDLTPTWELLVGARYFDWNIDNDQDTVFLGTSFGQEVGSVGDDDSFFKVQLTRHLHERGLVYLTRSEGFRIGGFNPFVGPNFNSSLDFLRFDPDRLINYEVGYKSSWANNRAVFNAAVYRMDWEDVQTVVRDSIGQFAFTTNATDLEVEGFELELATQDLIAPGVYASVNLAHTSNEFQRDAFIYPDVGRLLVEKGDSLRRTPDYTWAADFGYDFLVGGDRAGYLRANYWHKDRTTTEGFNGGDGAVPIPAQDVVSASAGLYMGKWEIKLVADNLTDAIPLLQVFPAAGGGPENPDATRPARASSIRPRSIALQLSYTP